ncbi:GNAT family N-acetyltransferase [Chitinophaga nivalis]|uniref:GNAT family N-acetyltransferase n=1 Tax=Chitinophaga nivalis TaxID=2991709 RepID=A0ABT3IMU9_9BACT|nr:GNAT family N-acetyltransferase [Chitinophaga nivalis]MCW3465198.1 GNAT family N-acetyltransferase [Chitinophaga nivalis]MCW3485110.1 GNAT family N-acetyltransferase [Chitinophaga nivalis]
MHITVKDTIHQPDYDTVHEMLINYNLSKTAHLKDSNNEPLEIIARDDNNVVIGGIYGRSLWGTLMINYLVVAEGYRDQRIGQQLIAAAEQEAVKRNCQLISLNTYSFQALPFYEKMGFSQIGEEANPVLGITKHFLCKKVGQP